VAKLSPKSLKIINPGVLEPTKIIVVVEKTWLRLSGLANWGTGTTTPTGEVVATRSSPPPPPAEDPPPGPEIIWLVVTEKSTVCWERASPVCSALSSIITSNCFFNYNTVFVSPFISNSTVIPVTNLQ
jgi:hypothetical protein